MSRPNVIVFFTDQQRWDTMTDHGNPLGLTPDLDRIARENTHVAKSFTCQPLCGPARACFQTGMYATQTGCYRNGVPLPQDAQTLAHCFNEGGYDTGYIGKWHLAPDNCIGPVERQYRGGYQYWLGANVLEFTSEAYNTVLYDNDNNPVDLPGYRVDALTDAAIKYIDNHRRDPFFLMISYLEPHHQNQIDDFPPPIGYRERYTGRWAPPDLATLGGSANQHLGGYFGMVKRLDEAYGRLIDALISLELLENTIVLFTSDHGCHFKTRNQEYKRSCHESSIRVPTVLSGPGFKGIGRLDNLVSLVDLPPTLLDAAGLDIPQNMNGRSILSLTKNIENKDWPDEVFIQISEAQTGRAIRTQRWKYSVSADSGESQHADQYHEEYLYDLQTDPYELSNLIGTEKHRQIAGEMKDLLLRYILEIEGKTPEIFSA